MSANVSTLLYLVSGVFFILSLRGLSSPETSRQGNYFGMAGMAIAVATTLTLLGNNSLESFGIIAAGVAIGGIIGAVIARRIAIDPRKLKGQKPQGQARQRKGVATTIDLSEGARSVWVEG